MTYFISFMSVPYTIDTKTWKLAIIVTLLLLFATFAADYASVLLWEGVVTHILLFFLKLALLLLCALALDSVLTHDLLAVMQALKIVFLQVLAVRRLLRFHHALQSSGRMHGGN